MPDIYHHFPIKAPARKVFAAVTTPEGLDAWWTKSSAGKPEKGGEYRLDFGPGYEWKAVVTRSASSWSPLVRRTYVPWIA